VDLRRHQAIKVLQLAREALFDRAHTYSSTGRAAMLTCEILYRAEEDGAWQEARDLLAQLVGTDQSKCEQAPEYLHNHPISDEVIKKQMLDGPKNNPSAPAPTSSRGRSRSRSPVKGTKQQKFNPRALSTRARNPPGRTEEQERRAPKDNRSKAKNKGANKSRSNAPARSAPLPAPIPGPTKGPNRPALPPVPPGSIWTLQRQREL
jgi:hypothetical protein